MRIRAKLSLFVIPLAMLPLLLVGLFSYRSLLKGFAEQAYLDDQQLCLLAAARIEQALDECHDSLILLSSILSSELRRPGGQSLEKVMAEPDNPVKAMARNFSIRYSPDVRLRFIAPEGKELFIAQGLQKNLQPGSALEEPIFLQAVSVSGQFPPVEQNQGRQRITTFAISLFDAAAIQDMPLRGFVFLDLDLEALAKILRNAAFARPGYYFLFDGSGKILAESGSSPLSAAQDKIYQAAIWRTRENPNPTFTQNAYAAGKQRFFISTRPVKEYIAFKEPIPEERWYLALVRSETPLLSAFRRSQMIFLVVLACGLMIAMAGAFYISKEITFPISQLTLAANELARGHLETSIAVKSRDEIGELATDFNRMAADLKQLIGERRTNETLVAIGKFSATLAHDLRNPIEGLKLLSRELCKRVGKNQSEYEIADTIAQAAERLSLLVNQSLDFARLHQPVFVTADLAALTDEVLQDFRFDEVELKKDFAHDLPPVKVDMAQIKRVLANLIRNALEACRSKRTSATCQIHMIMRATREKVHLEVADTGPGIPDEIREKIFEPFFSTKPTGHGLGLALARQIISNHGGAISFVSDIGQGTTFVIELPITQKISLAA